MDTMYFPQYEKVENLKEKPSRSKLEGAITPENMMAVCSSINSWSDYSDWNNFSNWNNWPNLR